VCTGFLALVACHTGAARVSASTGSGDESSGATPADVDAGRITFPWRGAGCAHEVRALSPDVRGGLGRLTAVAHASRAGASPTPRNVHLSFVGDPSTSVVVAWSTDAETLASEVRFGDAAGKLDRVAAGYSFTYAGAPGRRQHEVHLCGLAPGHAYVYQPSGDAPHRFVTAPDGRAAVRVLVAGDTRTGLDDWRAIAKRALEDAPEVMLLTGDAVDDGASQAQWDALFEAGRDLFASVPVVTTHGSHEVLSEVFFAQFAQPDNGTARGLEQWFGLTYGPLRVVVLNDTVLSFGMDVLESQSAFLKNELERVDRARTPFVVTLHHEPFYTSSSGHASNVALRAAWAPLYDRGGVDFDLAGHVHCYESTLPLRGGGFAEGGVVTDDRHGTRYFVFGGGGAPLHGFGAAGAWSSKRESTHGYAMLDASASALRWTAHRADGSVIETVTRTSGSPDPAAP
jgi:hypothetical protein